MYNNKLSHFTDVLCDEICDAQPISLSPSCESQSVIQEQDKVVSSSSQSRPYKHFGQKGHFRSREEIDIKYRGIFTYKYFNLVQSSVIEDALYSDKSMVVCAPTGSGKTVVFEMAIVQLLMEMDDKNFTDDFKIIYMAPVKALCTERLTEWYPKFTKLGLLCIEVTGDTDVEFPQLKPYRIIITTPEKWDMLTRRWKDHRGLVEVVKLFLIDEVHILNDQIRGPVLEAVVSRMKTIESSAQSSHRIEQLQRQYQGTSTSHVDMPAPRIRFIAISATVGNPEDVASWLGTINKPAVVYRFGDESRPVKLKRVVEGYPCPEGASIFKFDIVLNYKLWPIIQKYHNGKPTLIFCNTRKSVHLTAETLSREITVGFSPEQKAKLMNLASTIKTKKIQSLLLSGVGCHHAGLLFEERHVIEQAFRSRDLPILVTTTTLAMGVNLPAHLVIIKNTQQYVNGSYQEYSISTVLQMVGRAGRPQFDTEATAVIMTRMADKHRYEALVGGSEPLQSYLHKRIAENLNSEAALGTVADVAQCVQWLNSTFLSVRAARDPKRYLGLPQAAPATQISKKIEELCVKAMNGLATAGLISMDDACCISSTEAGRLMSIYYLDLETMKLIMKIEGSESLERLLWLICESHELSDMHLRVDERRCLNTLNRNNAAATIRFPMKGKINSRQMKLNCIIQAVLGCLPIPDPSLNQEAMKIIRTADRVCKCLVSYVTRPNLIDQKPKFFSAVLNSIILAKCISAQLWENSPYVSRQLKGIGLTFSTLLASAGKVNFSLLEESHPRDLERIINKGAPAGNILRKQIALLPKYSINFVTVDVRTIRVQLCLLNRAVLADDMDNLTAGGNHTSYIVVGDSDNYLIHYTSFRDSNLISVFDGCIDFEVERRHDHEHKIIVHCISSNVVGIDCTREHVFEDLNKIGSVARRSERSTEISNSGYFKERKRKNPNGNEIAQSKEKKKRDNNLMQKIKYLKESFSKVTKDIKGEFDKTKELSNSLLQNILLKEPLSDKEQSNALNVNCADVHENLPEEYDEVFASENFMDDEEIGNILNNIESEIIADNAKSKNNIVVDKNKNIALSKKTPEKNINQPIIKNIVKRRRINNIEKNNFNFLDILEKNASDDNENTKSVEESGLSNTVRYQIDQYLQKVQENSNLAQLLEVKPQTSFIEGDSNKTMKALRPNNFTYQLNDNSENIKSFKIDKKDRHTKFPNLNKDIDNNNISNTINEDNQIFDRRSDANPYKVVEILSSDTITKDDYPASIISNNYNMTSNFAKNEIPSNESSTLESKLNNDQILVPIKAIKHIDSESNERVIHSKNMPEVTSTHLVSKINDFPEKYNTTPIHNGESYENFEFTKNYFYSTTQISVTSEKIAKKRIEVIRKLKVDLNVTKIIYQDNNEHYANDRYSKRNDCTSEMINETKNIIERTNNDVGSSEILNEPNNKIICNNDIHCSKVINYSPNKIIVCTNNDVVSTFKGTSTRDDLAMDSVCDNLFEQESRQMENILKPVNSTIDIGDEEKPYHKDDADSTITSAAYIITKYKTKIASVKQYTQSQDNIKSRSNDEIKLQPVKPKKKYRISNLENIKISLPQSLMFKQASSNLELKAAYEPQNSEQNCTNVTENTYLYLNHENQNGSEKYSPYDAVDLATQNEEFAENKCISPKLLLDLNKTNSETDIDINQSMFDPKTLIQCSTGVRGASPLRVGREGAQKAENESPEAPLYVRPHFCKLDGGAGKTSPRAPQLLKPALLQYLSDNESSEIIPPPPEYCDSGPYSPVMLHDCISSNAYTKLESPISESFDNLFQAHEIAFDTVDGPPKEIETSILSRYDTSMDKHFYERLTKMRNNMKDIQSPVFNQRQAKLNQFKFKVKNKLK